jgi:hypothetical protein
MSEDILDILSVLSSNSDKNFVKRIMKPDDYPKLYDNPGGYLGKASTHSMAWGEDEHGNAYVYPTVIQNSEGELQRLSDEEAWKHAVITNERISFGKDKEKASRFSKNYKKVWKND